jgi:membrane-associated phospholipid phosphatase
LTASHIAVSLLLSVCLHSVVLGEAHSARTFFPHFFADQEEIWRFPTRQTAWRKPAIWFVVGASSAAFTLDGAGARNLRKDHSFNDFNSIFASKVSDLSLVAIPLALLASAEISGNLEFEELAWKSCESAAAGFLVAGILKTVTRRPRPHLEKGYGFWEGGNSFPSGHATVAWALAATTASHFRDRKWVALIVYPLAGVISFSRVTSGNHFPSDVVFGSALGFVIGRHVVN